MQLKIIAQVGDTCKINFLKKTETALDRRSGTGFLFRNSKLQIPIACKPALMPPTNTASARPMNMNRPVPQLNAPLDIKATCFDTSLRLGFSLAGKWLAPGQITKTRDGNVLIPGFEYDTTNYQINAHLIKCTQQGDTIWSRLIKGGFPGYSVIVYEAFELTDNSLLLAGDIGVPMPYNGRADLMLIRVSATGDLIWQKTFKTRVWDGDTTSGSMEIQDCKQDSNGDLYLCGNIRTGAMVAEGLAFKMDLSGNILWSNNGAGSSTPTFCGISVNPAGVSFFGRTYNNERVHPIAVVMDKSTGNITSAAAFSPLSGDYMQNLYINNMVTLNNGNLVISGRGATDLHIVDSIWGSVNAGYIEITPGLDFVRAYMLRSSYSVYGYNTVTTMFPDGSGAFARMGYDGLVQESVSLYGTFKNGQVLKERFIPNPGQYISWTSNFLQMDDGGQIITNFVGGTNPWAAFTEFMRLHNSDTAGSCLGSDTMCVWLEKLPFEKVPLGFTTVGNNTLIENQHPFFGVFNNTFQVKSNCRQISFCDSLRLSVSKDTVCTGTPVVITIHKNRECGSTPYWEYDSSNVALYQLNDSIITATINQVWQGRLLATINGCRFLQDSVRLTVLQSPGVLKLGTDTVICPGNKLLLNAKKGYATYTWQNGSSDSTFLVTAPGKYYVTVTDACTGVFSDTIIVSAHPPIPFELGPNLTICENDTLFISAQTGFIHYKWTGENIADDTLQSIIALQTVGNWYKVTGEKKTGCFVSDSLYVSLKQTPAIHLGPDTSICAGQQLLLNAGPGFTSYEWNTGEQQQQIDAGNQGSYNVKATLNGCYAYDTLQVLNVSPVPVFSLGSDTSICQGRQLHLIVNLAQATYKWNDGSTASKHIITQAGTFWLKVSQQGCSKSDTINVTFIATALVNLGRDTSLCEGKSIQLNAASQNATYIWQDGSITPGYLVKGPGRYFVTASLGNCDASDTIFVSYTPVPRFTLGRDTFLCDGQKLVLTPLLNSPFSLLWQDGRTSPSITVTKKGLYSLQATNECGNYQDTINITSGFCNIEMPSAFTPNDDGFNDVFKVKYPFPVKQFSMTIYNRFGEKIFETYNIGEGWNGNWKGRLQLQGTYVYMISFKGINNRQQNLKGTVTLIR